jgi:hypothetical protein
MEVMVGRLKDFKGGYSNYLGCGYMTFDLFLRPDVYLGFPALARDV